MGMSFISGSAESVPAPDLSRILRQGNPNPHNFEVLSCSQHGAHWLSVIRYPDCTTFEGKKVIVSTVDPRERRTFDPHFTDGGYIVARFEPTDQGLDYAARFIWSLQRGAQK